MKLTFIVSESLVVCRGLFRADVEICVKEGLEEEASDARRSARSGDSHAGTAVARQRMGKVKATQQRRIAREGVSEKCHFGIKQHRLQKIFLFLGLTLLYRLQHLLHLAHAAHTNKHDKKKPIFFSHPFFYLGLFSGS